MSAALRQLAVEHALVRGSSRDPLIRRGPARRVRRGVYCLDPSRKPSYAESIAAALLVLPAGSVACGLTAARLWRLDGLVPVTVDEPLEFLVPGRPNSIRLAGCSLHFTGMTGVALPAVEGARIPSTDLPRTLVDVLARLSFADAVVLLEAALQGDATLADAVAAELRRRTPRFGADVVRAALAFASPLSESVLESRARLLWHEAGLAAPKQQAVIRRAGRFVARVDFLWEAARLVVEVDGMAKYSQPGALREEKRRQNELVALGYTVLRFTWADVVQRPQRVVAAVYVMIDRE